jgi:energy-coupling factor transporter ATP-binding protein EcfA2
MKSTCKLQTVDDEGNPEVRDLAKLAINSMIGTFNMKDRSTDYRTMLITTDANNAFYHHLHNKGVFIQNRYIGGTNYFQVYNQTEVTIDDTEAPLYQMIIQLEAIELHKLARVIESKEGTVTDLCTDCISCFFPDDKFPFDLYNDSIIIKDYFFDSDMKVPKYKMEMKAKRQTIERLPGFDRRDTYVPKPIEWTTILDRVDNDFNPFVEQILDDKMSVNIDGPAGSGKSTLIKMLQEEMNKRSLNYITLAPTNKACRIINGTTIHKFIASFNKKSIQKADLQYCIVDEISMVPEIFYKFFLTLKKLLPNMNFIIAGDYRQLLPVKDRVEGIDYKNSAALWELCKGSRIQLSKCRRSDDVLFNLCKPENIYNVRKDQFKNAFTDVHLSFKNETRKAINDKMMKQHVEATDEIPLCIKQLSYDPNSQDVQLINGTPIMARVNNKTLDIFNNETFMIANIDHKKQQIQILNDIDADEECKSFTIDVKDFQKLFYVAYCITIHKSQGISIDTPYTIHDWRYLDSRLKYVALSRATDIDNINII